MVPAHAEFKAIYWWNIWLACVRADKVKPSLALPCQRSNFGLSEYYEEFAIIRAPECLSLLKSLLSSLKFIDFHVTIAPRKPLSFPQSHDKPPKPYDVSSAIKKGLQADDALASILGTSTSAEFDQWQSDQILLGPNPESLLLPPEFVAVEQTESDSTEPTLMDSMPTVASGVSTAMLNGEEEEEEEVSKPKKPKKKVRTKIIDL